jgi:hypothetical protein
MSHTKKKNIIEGWLNKKKNSMLSSLVVSWNKRYFIFDGSCLSYYQSEMDDDHKFWGASDTISIADIKGIEMDLVDTTIFKLFTINRIYILQAETETECYKWYKILKLYIEKNENKDVLVQMTKKYLDKK